MQVSVVIPTYNRRAKLWQTLVSLQSQTLPPDEYEVIVVDDGSEDGTQEAAASWSLPCSLRCYRQEKGGAVAARNYGARQAIGEVLAFLDDDMVLSPEYLSELLHCYRSTPKALVVGTLRPFERPGRTIFERVHGAASLSPEPDADSDSTAGCVALAHIYCLSGLLAVNRCGFFDIGMLRRLAEGGPEAWSDIAFAHRAVQQGYGVVRAVRAVAYHDDGSCASLEVACRTARKNGRAAVLLFRTHPELEPAIVAYRDMGYVSWGRDSPVIAARKIARGIMAWPPALWMLEQVTRLVGYAHPAPVLLRPLYRWVLGTHICLGYREGLRKQRV